MTFYLLLNLALIIVAAGVIPVLASQDGDDSTPEQQRSATQEAEAAAKRMKEEQKLIGHVLAGNVDKLREAVRTQAEFNVELDHTKTAGEQNLQVLQSELSTLKSVLAEAQRNGDVKKEDLATLKEQVEQLSLQEKALGASTNAADNFGKAQDKLLGLADEWRNSMVGGLISSIEQGESLGNTLNAVGEKLVKNMHPLRLIGNLVSKIQDATKDLALAQDKAITSVTKSTQAYGLYDDEIISINMELRTQGVGLDKIGAAYTTLTNTLTTFDTLQSSVRRELGETSSYLQLMGADAGTVARTMTTASTAFGISEISAGKFTRQVAALAGKLKIDLNKAMQDFNEHAGYLAMFGNKGGKVFAQLATAADSLKISMGSLVAIVEQFQTFEGATNAAGRLNAALGGDFINNMELMKASFEDPVDALRQMKEAILAGAGSFDNMNNAQKLFMAKSAGLKDVGELAALLSGDLEKARMAQEANALSMEELREHTKATQEIGELWSNTLRVLAVNIAPVLKKTKEFVVELADLALRADEALESVGGLMTVIAPFAVGMGLLLFVVAPLVLAIGALTPGLTTLGVMAPVAGAGIKGMATTLGSAGTLQAMAFAGLGLAALGAGMMVISLSGAVAAKAAMMLANALVKMGSVGEIKALSNLAQHAWDLAKFSTAAWEAEDDIEDLATAFEKLKTATTGLDGFKPFTDTIKAVVELEQLGGTPVVDKLVRTVVEYDESKLAVAAAPRPATPVPSQSAFPETVKLVISNKNGAAREFTAFLETKIDARIEPVVKKLLRTN